MLEDIPFFDSETASERADFTLVPVGNSFAKVDQDCLPIIKGRTWSLNHCRGVKLYARNIRHQGELVNVYMHRLIAIDRIGEAPRAGMVVDHINGDSLDNRVSNLRWLCAYANRWQTARHN